MILVVVVAVQVVSINLVLPSQGLLFCRHSVYVVIVLLDVCLPVFVVRLGGDVVSFAVSVGGSCRRWCWCCCCCCVAV